MKKIGIISLLFLTISFTKTESTNYNYTVKIYPAFMPASEVELTNFNNTGKIKLTVLKDLDFPETFKDSAVLSEEDFKYFSESLSGISLAKIKDSQDGAGSDGTTFVNIYKEHGRSNKFNFWTPKKDSKYCKIADAIIGLLKRKFHSDFEIRYLKKLESRYKR